MDNDNYFRACGHLRGWLAGHLACATPGGQKASNEEWQSLYNETRARNADLEKKIDELRSENLDLKLENEKLKAQIQRNTEDINELRGQVKNLLAKV